MKILFVHQNFPGQFRHLAPALVRQGHSVTAFAMNRNGVDGQDGVRLRRYRVARGSAQGVHPWLIDLESKVIRGEACFHEATLLAREGWAPDLIIAHPGWGESLFLKDVWPRTKLAL